MRAHYTWYVFRMQYDFPSFLDLCVCRVFTSYRSEEVRFLATRVIVLYAGNLVFDGTPEMYFKSKTQGEMFL